MIGPSPDDVRRRILQGAALLTGVGAVAYAASPNPAADDVVQDGHAITSTGVVDLRAFGAKLDGSSDDSAALREAARTGRPITFQGSLRIDQVVDLPPETVVTGAGVYRSTLMLGRGGKVRIAGRGFGNTGGGGVFRDITIAPPDRAGPDVALELRHIEHFLFDNVTFYRMNVVLDDHHYVTFRTCRFLGDQDRVALKSICESQPRGKASISECPLFAQCFFSTCPVSLEDTVGARFTDCTFMSGRTGITSVRKLSAGSAAEPFFMGPVISGCVFDSIDGVAIDIDGGGTDCRISNNFISAGRGRGKPGVALTASSSVQIIGNQFEWCGSAGIALNRCERIGVIGNTFANMANGAGVFAQATAQTRVIGNAFDNRMRWGGSAAGGTTLAIQADNGCRDWIVTGNTATGLRNGAVSVLADSLVTDNLGWPPATEQGWPAGPSGARPQGVRDGYRWYDDTIGPLAVLASAERTLA